MDGGCRGIGAIMGVVLLLLLMLSVTVEPLASADSSMPRGLSSWRWCCFCGSEEEEPFREKENLEKRPPLEVRLVGCGCGGEFSLATPLAVWASLVGDTCSMISEVRGACAGGRLEC